MKSDMGEKTKTASDDVATLGFILSPTSGVDACE